MSYTATGVCPGRRGARGPYPEGWYEPPPFRGPSLKRGAARQPFVWYSPEPYRGPRPLRRRAAQQPAQWDRPRLFRIPRPGWSAGDQQPVLWFSPQRYRSPGRMPRRRAALEPRQWYEPGRFRSPRSPFRRGAGGDAVRWFEPQRFRGAPQPVRDEDSWAYSDAEEESEPAHDAWRPIPGRRRAVRRPRRQVSDSGFVTVHLGRPVRAYYPRGSIDPRARGWSPEDEAFTEDYVPGYDDGDFNESAAWNRPRQTDFLQLYGLVGGREPAVQYVSLQADTTDEDENGAGFGSTYIISRGRQPDSSYPSIRSDEPEEFGYSGSGEATVYYTPLVADIPDESQYHTADSRRILSEPEESRELFHTADGLPYGLQPIGETPRRTVHPYHGVRRLDFSSQGGGGFGEDLTYEDFHPPMASTPGRYWRPDHGNRTGQDLTYEDFRPPMTSTPGRYWRPVQGNRTGEDLTYEDFRPPVTSTPGRYWKPDQGNISDESLTYERFQPDFASTRRGLGDSGRFPVYYWR